ncbi:sigma-70 family RNA polymerase sigma factor [Spirosoma sp. HMF4905]|uniref:Sigma-70 family RNA polymerase sigma factor n=1 Tax=Spirosoma arboris TaxID=2682092 RepID=A0A7K1SB10_9BACT|nr:sigma-70 family RNA polymerase sigma factor [Spirosoma arboris]MVM30858.1 sigma-70 family RNA polymerase sigma factor [Spirosoma arboris]
MSTPDSLLLEQELLSGLKANNQLAFSKLYDRYGAILLGIIMKIVFDKTEAVSLLETTFTTIRLRIDQFRPGKQPLFLWLLQIARSTALEALNEHGRAKTVPLQLTKTGEIINPAWQKSSPNLSGDRLTNLVDSQSKALLDSILFENCTPEEAANSIGIPVELARQKLRVALQQLRTTPKA